MSRRGRPRKTAERRLQPNYSDARQEAEAISVALEARSRMFGLPLSQTPKNVLSSFLGRLRAREEISERQYEAAKKYQDLMRQVSALHMLRGFPEAGNLDRGGGYDGSDGTEEDYVARFKATMVLEERCRRALAEANHSDSRTATAIQFVVLHDYDQPHLVGAIRIGLNALARIFGIPVTGQRVDNPPVLPEKQQSTRFAQG